MNKPAKKVREALLVASPNGLDAIQWIESGKSVRTEPVSPALLSAPLASAKQIRTGEQYQYRLNRHGFYHWHRTSAAVWFESNVEQDALVELDFGGALAVASQPMRILFGNWTDLVSHVPDFFVVASDGAPTVVDVKPSARINDAAIRQFDATRAVCDDIGWRYEVMVEQDKVRARNLAYLRAARSTPWHPQPEVFDIVREVFRDGRALADGVHRVSQSVPAIGYRAVRHLLWHRLLTADLHTTLGADSAVTTTRGAAPCCTE